jgi:2-polyprenyl-6-hydroxyphenyl methylase/3-demethylubiquinone-9 3-methyltransferase
MRDSRDRNLEAHFSFGQNWSDYSELVSETHITFAENELSRLMNTDNLQDLKWCDLGCGSGIHSVAAARLGATVTAVDIDPISTATTEKLARKFGVESKIEVLNFSVFDHSLSQESFDVVYSWGVLHHTGDMWSAIDGATALLSKKTGSQFVVALYRKTKLCRLWNIEKRLYKNAPVLGQRAVRGFFVLAYDLSLLVRRKNPRAHRRNYLQMRGMSFSHDVHDWLGGYPYESVSAEVLFRNMRARGFTQVRSFVRSPHRAQWGFFGSGCDEFVFERDLSLMVVTQSLTN